VTRSKVHSEDIQIFGDTLQNFSRATVGRDLYCVLTWGRESYTFHVALEDCLFNVVVSSTDCIWVSRKWRYTRWEVRGSYSSITEDAGRDVTDVSVNRSAFIFRLTFGLLGPKDESITILEKNWRTVYPEQTILRKYIPIYIQQDATLHTLFISGNCSTCFGW